MEAYKIHKVIGDGSFGTVSKATHIKTGEIVAIKKIKKKFHTWDECMSLRELKSLRKLNHPNIIKLKEAIKFNDELYFVFEFLDQNLYQMYNSMRESGKSFTENQIRSIIYQTAAGLAYTHKSGFFHRDLKPENLLAHKESIKIADYGLAREIRSRPPYTDYVATRWYRAPEILLKSTTYNSPVDIFALGCIMAELYTLAPLFKGNSEMDQIYKICSILGTPTQTTWSEGFRLAAQMGFNFPQFPPVPLQTIIPNASEDAIQLITEMLKYDAHKRPSAQQVLQHSFFAGYVHIDRAITPQMNESSPVLHNKSRDGSPIRQMNRMNDYENKAFKQDSPLRNQDNSGIDSWSVHNSEAPIGKGPREKNSERTSYFSLKRTEKPTNVGFERSIEEYASPKKVGLKDNILSPDLLEEEINQVLEDFKADFSPDNSKSPTKKTPNIPNRLPILNQNLNSNLHPNGGDISLSKPFLPIILGGPARVQAGHNKLDQQNYGEGGYGSRYDGSPERRANKNLGQLGPSPYDFLTKNPSNQGNSYSNLLMPRQNHSPLPDASLIGNSNQSQAPYHSNSLNSNNNYYNVASNLNYQSPNRGPLAKHPSLHDWSKTNIDTINVNNYGFNNKEVNSHIGKGFDHDSVFQEEVGVRGRYKF